MPSRVRVGNARLPVGDAIDVTIDPALQAIAQRVAACYTGRQDVCRALGIARKEDEGKPIGHRLLEHALVRMAAVAIVDVETRTHRGARRRAFAVHARGVRRTRPLAAMRPAHAVSDPLQPRRAAESRGVPRRDARIDDQADHGRGVPVRSRRRQDVARRRARGDAAHAVARRATACAASSCARTRRASSTACSASTASLRRLPRGRGKCRRRRAAFGWNVDCAQDAREGCGKRNLLFGDRAWPASARRRCRSDG